MQLTVKLEAGRVYKGLNKIADAIPDVGFRVVWRMMKAAMERAKTYPPELPNQRYIRTGTYGRSFKIAKLGNGVIGARIESDAVQRGRHYTVYVGGNAMGRGQARIHNGRWAVIADVVQQDVLNQVAKEIETDMHGVIAQQGMGL